MGAAYLLPRIVGAGRAAEILLLGDEIDAAAAEKIGLANWVVPDEQLMPRALSLAERLAEGPAFALAMTKRMIENEWNLDLIAATEAEAQAQALLMMGEDHRRFYQAFQRKARPEFTGR
jgi:enoyl-CoA hydratase/carnithine racemase